MFETGAFIEYSGLLIVILAVYAQMGLFFCFFVPSGGFMFTAGVLIAADSFGYDIFTVCTLLALAAIAGSATGYWFGRSAVHLLYARQDSRFFKKQYLLSAEGFYKKYGAIALTASPFLPLIRTFSPIMSGMIKLDFRRFMVFTIIGSIGYVLSFTLAGYLIGSVPGLKPYLKYFVIIIILVVTIPLAIRIIRELQGKRADV